MLGVTKCAEHFEAQSSPYVMIEPGILSGAAINEELVVGL
jgi:hypothetical protein